MKRKTALLLLVIVSLAGSFATFYVSNLVFSDIGNSFYGVRDTYAIASIPGFMLVPDLVLVTLYIVRTYMKPEYKKRTSKLYAILLSVFSAMGLGTAIYSGVEVYKSFVAPYPFPGYIIIAVIFHGTLLIFGIVLRIMCGKLPEDNGKQRMNLGYVIYTAVVAIFIFFTYNRLGAFLWAPIYMHWNTLYMTFPFYISLLLPAGMLANNVGFLFGYFENQKQKRAANIVILLALTVIMGAAVFIIGATNTQFISVISPALALERLATLPIDVIIQFGLLLIFGVYFLIITFKREIRKGWGE